MIKIVVICNVYKKIYHMLPKYKRVLLKLSGEALLGQNTNDPFDPKVIEQYAYDIKDVTNLGVQVAIVIGGGNIFRGVAGFLALLFFFYNIANIPLGEAMTFSKTSTIFTALLAYFFLKEQIGIKGWIGVIVGFIGILFIAEFDGSSLEKTDYLGILSGFGAALAYTSIRELRRFYDSRAIVLSFMAVGTIFPLIFMIISEFYTNPHLDFMLGTFVMPEARDWIFIALLGVFSTYAQIYMTKSYSLAKAGIVSTVSYSNIAFSIVLGLFMGDAFPSFIVLLGIILIVISGIMVSKK